MGGGGVCGAGFGWRSSIFLGCTLVGSSGNELLGILCSFVQLAKNGVRKKSQQILLMVEL